MYRWVLLVFGGLLVVRLLGVYNLYFLEEDEISLAAGIAALVRNNVGDLYRYTPQLGYHRIVEWVDLALGGDVSRIPGLMKLWSVLVGALVPALGLLMFRDVLSVRERWLVTLSLAVNPILWRSSQYGNTAMASLGFVALAYVFLSGRASTWGRVLGLGAFCLAVFVRADAIVLGPLIAFLLYRQFRALRPTAIWLAGLGVAALAGAAVIYALDPRLDGAAAAVATHMFQTENRTQFWEYLIWSMSPLALVFAVLGLRALADSRLGLLAVVALGALGPMAFYFRATTTPRYFVLATIPLALAMAVGIEDVAGRLRGWLGRRAAWSIVLGVATIHLFVGLGQFRTDRLGAIVTGARIPTHDGMMPTGALLYDTYLRGGLLHQSFRNPGFGQNEQNFEGVLFGRALSELEARDRGKVLLLFDAGWDHVFHFHAQEAGATYISRAPGDSSAPFASETWLDIGETSVMTIRLGGPDYASLPRFDVTTGDELWITGTDDGVDRIVQQKLPPGLELTPMESFHPRIRLFRVTASDGKVVSSG